MATSRTSGGRSLVGWFVLAAGVLYLLGILFSFISAPASGWWNFFAFALLAVGLVLLFLWRTSTLLRVAFIVAAVGWALLAINSVAGLGAALVTIAILLALIGTLVAGILVFLRHTFTRNADLAFLLMAIFAALLLLSVWVSFLGGTLGLIIAIIFGILLIVSGLLIQRRR